MITTNILEYFQKTIFEFGKYKSLSNVDLDINILIMKINLIHI